jgi:hypothetical protein
MQYFRLEEIVDKKTFEQYGISAWQLFDLKALTMLDDLRAFFGVPITCNDWHRDGQFSMRGYRPGWTTVGAKNSPHKLGKAFDVDVHGISAEEARSIIKADMSNPLLANIQRIEAEVNWLHIDIMKPPEGKERIYFFHP